MNFKKNDETHEILIEKEDENEILYYDYGLDKSFQKVFLFSQNNELLNFISTTVDEYKNTTTWDLINILHSKDSAWFYVWDEKNINKEISNELIMKYKY